MAWSGTMGGWTLLSWLGLDPGVSGNCIHGLVWTLGWLDITWYGPRVGWTLLGVDPEVSGHCINGLAWNLGGSDIAIMAWSGPLGVCTLHKWLGLDPGVAGH